MKARRLEFVELLADQGLFVEPDQTPDVIQDDGSDNRDGEYTLAGHVQHIVPGAGVGLNLVPIEAF